MDEYISKHKAYTMMKDLEAAYIYPPVKEAYGTAARHIDQMPAADVQPVSQWISVEDRPPNHYEEVFVVSKLENIVYFAWYDADISMFMGHSHMWTTREVTHWMPLPKPPKDGDSE